MPKGVEMSQYTLLLISEIKNLDMTNAVSIWFSSLYWISGVMMNFKAIAQGAKVIIYPEFDEEMTCLLIEKYKVTLIFLSTSMISRFLRADCVKKYPLSSLKVIIFGGAGMKAKTQEDMRRILPHVHMLQGFGKCLFNVIKYYKYQNIKHRNYYEKFYYIYIGMTELGGIATLQLPNHKNGSCGTVIQNVQIKIVDPENGKILGPNQSGEIWIKAATMMNGYHRNPEATKNTIDEEGWLHSGDIGYFDEDGELFIIDRIKELIKYRGYQISPGEIEDVLLSHPAVLEVAVVAVPHEIDDEHPIAYVTKRPDVKVTEQELIEFVANNMMDQYKLRAGVIFLDSFPYTGSGKIARKDLKAMAKKLAKE
ncbi:hypothetical protein ACFW04_006056 [Cataglyphis niger]